MAYLDNYIGGKVYLSGKTDAEIIAWFSDVIVNNVGGLLVDTVSATCLVFKIQPQAKMPPVFVRLTATSGRLRFDKISYYYDPSTHVHYRAVSSGFDLSCLCNQWYGFFIYAGPGVFHLVESGSIQTAFNASTPRWGFHYLSNYFHPDASFFSTGAFAAGSNVFVPLDSSPVGLISPGFVVSIVDSANGGAFNMATVSAVSPAGITLAALSNSFSSGSYVYLGSVFSCFSQSYRFNLICQATVGVGTDYSSGSLYVMTNSSMIASWFDADYAAGGRKFTAPFCSYSNCYAYGVYDTSAFLGLSSPLANNDFLLFNNDDSPIVSGTATSGTLGVLTDDTRSFIPDSLVGKFITISGGSNAGHCSKIFSNDATSITLTTWCPWAFASTSAYSISDIVFRVASGAYWSAGATLACRETV